MADVRAGQGLANSVMPGQAARITTGAPVPDGADAIVMVEDTVLLKENGLLKENVDKATVVIHRAAAPGAHIRRPGEDVVAGTCVLAPGVLLGPAQLGLAAAVGRRSVFAHPRPRVAVLSTGDELVEGPQLLGPGQIYDSNRPALLAAVAEAGATPVDFGIVADDYAALTDSLLAAAVDADLVVTSGGVSMGDFDLVKRVLDRLGDMRWMQLAIKPGKPFAVGTIQGTPVLGLPGNPVSSLVSFELLARPAIRQLAGEAVPSRQPVSAVADGPLPRRPDGKVHFFRVLAMWGDDGRIHVRPVGVQASHVLSGLAYANALAIVADGDGVPAGGKVSVLLLESTLPPVQSLA